jgi:hypothetical protein
VSFTLLFPTHCRGNTLWYLQIFQPLDWPSLSFCRGFTRPLAFSPKVHYPGPTQLAGIHRLRSGIVTSQAQKAGMERVDVGIYTICRLSARKHDC